MKKSFIKIAIIGLVLALCLSISACSKPDNKESYQFYDYESSYILNDNFSVSGARL